MGLHILMSQNASNAAATFLPYVQVAVQEHAPVTNSKRKHEQAQDTVEAMAAEKAKAKAAEKANAKAAEKAKAKAAKKAKAKAAKKAKAKAAEKAKAVPQCKCKACESCHPDTKGDWCYGVKCGRECPGCAFFKEMFHTPATFTVNGKLYTGCSTCKIIKQDGVVSELCTTCFSWTCKKPRGSGDKEEPLGENEIRLYRYPKGKGGMGLAGGFILNTMPITQARELFNDLGQKKSLARLTCQGAEGAVKT